MRRFALGAVCGALAVASLVGAFSLGAHHAANAETTWQVKQFYALDWNDGAHPRDPNRYVNDWLETLPAACRVQPVYIGGLVDEETDVQNPYGAHFYYACP